MAQVTVTVDSGITVDVVDRAVQEAALQALKDQVTQLTSDNAALQAKLDQVKAIVNA